MTESAQTAREEQLTDTVLASFAGTPDPRLKTILTSLTTHLHSFLREVRLTEAEWTTAIEFITAAGQITDEHRQEFILLSDVLGLSMQTVIMNHDEDEAVTESTVLGPFFVTGAPEIANGDDMSFGANGEPCWVEGTVVDPAGAPIPGARLEIWEADDDGFYDVQYDDSRVAARAHLFTDTAGAYRFWALTPTPYPIPDDGPVGRLLNASMRSPLRAPHLHFMVSAPSFKTLITHIFVAGDALGSDSVFGIRPSLVKEFLRQSPDIPGPDGREMATSWTRTRFDIVLARQA